jgi:hypothetical protein
LFLQGSDNIACNRSEENFACNCSEENAIVLRRWRRALELVKGSDRGFIWLLCDAGMLHHIAAEILKLLIASESQCLCQAFALNPET